MRFTNYDENSDQYDLDRPCVMDFPIRWLLRCGDHQEQACVDLSKSRVGDAPT